LNSDKIVYGFDTFSGLPKKSPEDAPEVFDALHYEGQITDKHYDDIVKLRKYRSGRSLSRSGDFSHCSANRIKNKARLLGLDNFKLITGPFKRTMTGDYTFMAGLMDWWKSAIGGVSRKLVPIVGRTATPTITGISTQSAFV